MEFKKSYHLDSIWMNNKKKSKMNDNQHQEQKCINSEIVDITLAYYLSRHDNINIKK